MELSYTQNLEDYHLALAFAGQRSGRYIDIGGALFLFICAAGRFSLDALLLKKR